MKHKLILILLLLSLMALSASSPAFVPRLINYQGILTDPEGFPIDGTHDLTFRIYPDSVALAALWTEQHLSVDIENGLFNVILGRFVLIPDSLFATAERWIGISVNLDPEMAPKMKMTAVPWAFRAAVAESALVSAAFAPHTHDDRYYTESELNTPGTINTPTNPVDWTMLKNVPAGFADGSDDGGSGAGDGHSLDAADGSPVDVVYVDINGHTGVGTTTPAAFLNVAENQTVLFGADSTSDGTKLMWLPARAAFRAGESDYSSWHPDSIGQYSFAAGRGVVADGEGSVAMGEVTIARGDNSVALGNGSTTDNTGGFAMGSGAQSAGNYAVAFGFNSQALGTYSLAVGGDNRATNQGSIALGYRDDAEADYAVAIGNDCTASGVAATAIGEFATASGDYAVAIGENTTASADYAVAMGELSVSSGVNSFTAGSSNQATYPHAIAMGWSCEATRNGAVALGRNNTASGFSATALGENTTASGYQSLSLGENTNAESYLSVALGRYNVGGGSQTYFYSSDPIFEIGIGSGNLDRENAVTVLKGGNVGIGTATPDNLLHVNGTVQIGSAETIRDVGGYALWVEASLAPETDDLRNLGSAAHRWNTVYATNGTINTSDGRLKESVADLAYGLDEVMQLRPVSFKWRDSHDQGTHLGLIAQDVQPLVGEVVKDTETTGIEGSGQPQLTSKPAETLGINYSELIPVLIKAIQEQQKFIQGQAEEINQLKDRISRIE